MKRTMTCLVAAVPALVTVVVSRPVAMAAGTGSGYWPARGAQLVDASGTPVRMTGINWFGSETANLTFHGLWSRNHKDMLGQMAQSGYNTVRVPHSSQSYAPSLGRGANGPSSPGFRLGGTACSAQS